MPTNAGLNEEITMTAERAADRWAFAQRHVAGAVNMAPASSDASFRSYWRVTSANRSYIVMDAPPEREDCRPFIAVAQRLRAAGLNAPEVHAEDLKLGFLLLSDLGSRSYLPELNSESADTLYADALQALARMQSDVPTLELPEYDAVRLQNEMELFPEWFLARHLGYSQTASDRELLASTFKGLLDSALLQPRSFVHRDYHSRNLMIVPEANPGILDFQDAVLGPVTYDLVSLLRDCYIAWPEERVYAWVEQHRLTLSNLGVCHADSAQFRRWFDWMGVQRHLKVLGIFARLHYRDGKASYLQDLPLVLHYVLTACQRYRALQPFAMWLQARTAGLDLTVARV